jgi:hypothetical protein
MGSRQGIGDRPRRFGRRGGPHGERRAQAPGGPTIETRAPVVGDKVRVPGGRCRCGATLTGAAEYGGNNPPLAGAVTVCVYCGHLYIFNDDLTLREATSAELDEMMRDAELMQTISQMRDAARRANLTPPNEKT